MFQKSHKIRDDKYKALFQHLKCCNGVGCGGDTVAAHCGYGIPQYKKGGMGQKHCDTVCVPLCFNCHAKQHSMPEKEFWGDREPYLLAERLWLFYRHDKSAAGNWKSHGGKNQYFIKVMNKLIDKWTRGELR